MPRAMAAPHQSHFRFRNRFSVGMPDPGRQRSSGLHSSGPTARLKRALKSLGGQRLRNEGCRHLEPLVLGGNECCIRCRRRSCYGYPIIPPVCTHGHRGALINFALARVLPPWYMLLRIHQVLRNLMQWRSRFSPPPQWPRGTTTF